MTTDIPMGAAQKRIKSLLAPPDAMMDKKRRDTTGQSQSGEANILVFPMDLSTHYMAFQFYRYVFEDNSFQQRKLHKTILLPVPLQLVETINIQYNESSLGAIRGELSDMAGRGDLEGAASKGAAILKAGVSAGAALVDGVGGGISGIKDAIREQGGNLGIGSLLIPGAMGRGGSGAVAAGLNRYFGSAPNPHITTLFQGVGLRQHNFNWKLAPASKQESDALSKIIDSLRAAILPGRGLGNFTLNFPDECEIYIMGTNTKYMYHFKTAVVKNMVTNFAPDGVLSFFGGTGAPTAVTLDLQLGETVLHTREDYDPVANFIGAQEDDTQQIYKDLENLQAALTPKAPITKNTLFQGIQSK